MSKAKDRARAESGWIFREGHLVRKEDWYKAHPTKTQRQTQVDDAVADIMKAKGVLIVKDGRVLDFKDTSAVLSEAEPYYCTRCKVTHRRGKIFQEHHQFASQIAVV